MEEALRATLEGDGRILFALVFGSTARGTAHAHSDLDVAIELAQAVRLEPLEVGEFIGRLEDAAGRRVDLVLLNEAPPTLAYRVFRDGVLLFSRDREALVARKTRAVLDYLDFKPVEELCTRGVLARARRG